MSLSITVETVGRRHYLRGNTYPIKDALRSAGAHWDRDAGAWWTGQRDVAERLVSGASSGAIAATVSWTKLPDGTWGIRSSTVLTAGAVVTVRKASGETSQVTIAAIVSTSDDGSCLASVAAKPRAPRAGYRGRSGGRGRWNGCSCGARELPGGGLSAIACASCRFDEYDC